jgi:hypothetical protein
MSLPVTSNTLIETFPERIGCVLAEQKPRQTKLPGCLLTAASSWVTGLNLKQLEARD